MIITVTSQIHLSAITAADVTDITSHMQEREVSRYTRLILHPYFREMAEQWIVSLANDVERNGRETIWAIRERSGRMIGAIELHPGRPGSTHESEIGYWLAKPFWGGGIMTTVVGAIVQRGFHEFGVRRIIAPIFLPNIASARVLEKNGFMIEAPLLRLAYQRDGQFFDGRLYARVRDD